MKIASLLCVVLMACGGDGDPACDPRCDVPDGGEEPCTPATCASAGAQCGSLDDGCGGTLDCGDACADDVPWLTCGGGGAANTCGAVCELPCPAGTACTDGVCSFASDVPLDVETHAVTFRFRLDGAAPADTSPCANPQTSVGVFSATNLGAGGGVVSGQVSCGTQWTVGPFTLPPGTYRASVRGGAGVTDIPTTTTSVEVPVTTDGEVVVDVPSVHVRGTIVLGGAAPAEIGCTAGELVGSLELRTAGSETVTVPVPCGGGFAFDARLFAGDYQVTVRGTAHSNLPAARLVLPALHVAASIDGLVLDAGEQAMVSGTLTIGGAAPTTAPTCQTYYEGARVSFFKGDTLVAFASMPCDGPFTYAVRLPPDTYTVRARSVFYSGITQPSFDYGELPPIVVGAAPVTYDVDVPLVDVTGTLTLGGQPPTEDASCIGNAANLSIGLRAIAVPCQGDFHFGPAPFVPGTYSVSVGGLPGTDLPTSAVATLVVPPQGGPVVLDVRPEHTLRVKLLVDGATPDDGGCTSGEVARLDVRSVAPGLYASVGVACGADFEASVVLPDDDYTLETGPGASNVPLYTSPQVVALHADTSVTLDIPTRSVMGQLTMNGAAPTETAACTAGLDVAEVRFTSAYSTGGRAMVATIPCGAGFAFGPLALAPGVYRVAVRPLGSPARSDLPASEVVAIPRFAVD